MAQLTIRDARHHYRAASSATTSGSTRAPCGARSRPGGRSRRGATASRRGATPSARTARQHAASARRKAAHPPRARRRRTAAIVSEEDIARAVERTGAYVALEGEKERRAEPLAAAAGREHGEWPASAATSLRRGYVVTRHLLARAAEPPGGSGAEDRRAPRRQRARSQNLRAEMGNRWRTGGFGTVLPTLPFSSKPATCKVNRPPEGWPSPVEGSGLENRQGESPREFESPPLRFVCSTFFDSPRK